MRVVFFSRMYVANSRRDFIPTYFGKRVVTITGYLLLLLAIFLVILQLAAMSVVSNTSSSLVPLSWLSDDTAHVFSDIVSAPFDTPTVQIIVGRV